MMPTTTTAMGIQVEIMPTEIPEMITVATVIISGISVGMISTWIPIAVVVVGIMLAFYLAGGGDNFLLGLYGVGIAAVGMLSTLGITLASVMPNVESMPTAAIPTP